MTAYRPGSTRRARRRLESQRIRQALKAASLAIVSSASWLPRKIVQGASYVGMLLTLWESAEAAFREEEEDDGAG